MILISLKVCLSVVGLVWSGIHRTYDLPDGTYNPFATFNFTGDLRPRYPLSSRRPVPDNIPKPDYIEDGMLTKLFTHIKTTMWAFFFFPLYSPGVPISENRRAGQPIKILTPEEQEKMRTVCRVSIPVSTSSILRVMVEHEKSDISWSPRYRCFACSTRNHNRCTRRNRT